MKFLLDLVEKTYWELKVIAPLFIRDISKTVDSFEEILFQNINVLLKVLGRFAQLLGDTIHEIS